MQQAWRGRRRRATERQPADDEAERNALCQDLLINVTEFFRGFKLKN